MSSFSQRSFLRFEWVFPVLLVNELYKINVDDYKSTEPNTNAEVRNEVELPFSRFKRSSRFCEGAVDGLISMRTRWNKVYRFFLSEL
ncbi:hypothetical protein WN48_08782 [Eufriesea mexicana]|nr:hypothetical protein WN48_08782 [Eufriesea mexicana]